MVAFFNDLIQFLNRTDSFARMACIDELREARNRISSLDSDIADCQANKNTVNPDKNQKIIADLEADYQKQLEISKNAEKELQTCSGELRSWQIHCRGLGSSPATTTQPPFTAPSTLSSGDETEIHQLKIKIKELEGKVANSTGGTCETLDKEEKIFENAFDTDFYFRSY